MAKADLPENPPREWIELMEHATAWPRCYRNYFAAEPGGDDAVRWDAMVEAGLAYRGVVINPPPYELQIYNVTDAGMDALRDATKET